LRADTNGTPLRRLGNEEAEMQAKHALVGTAMGRQLLAGGEDREERGLHAGHAPEKPGRLRTTAAIRHRLDAAGIEEERLPAVVLREVLLVLRDILEIRHVRGVGKERIELVADLAPVAFDGRDPGKILDVEELVVAERRGPPEIGVEPPDELPSEP